jgi:hypothetical protein
VGGCPQYVREILQLGSGRYCLADSARAGWELGGGGIDTPT